MLLSLYTNKFCFYSPFFINIYNNYRNNIPFRMIATKKSCANAQDFLIYFFLGFKRTTATTTTPTARTIITIAMIKPVGLVLAEEPA